MKEKKTLIIVCDDVTDKYGAYLQQLVSSCDDDADGVVGTKDGTVIATLWDAKHYEGNKYTLSSNAHVLFMGNSDLAKARRATMEEKRFIAGMHYGCLGAQAYLYVDEGSLNASNYEAFKSLCDSYDMKFGKDLDLHFNPEKSKEPAPTESKKEVNTSFPFALAVGIAGAVVGGAKAVAGFAMDVVDKGNDLFQMSEALDQQYQLITRIFYMDALSEFMGN